MIRIDIGVASRPLGSGWVAGIAVVLLVALASSCAGSRRDGPPADGRQTVLPAAPTTREAGVHHTVQAGQTLWRISRVYGVPLEELVRVNGLDDPAALDVGQSVFIPGATELLALPSSSSARFDWPVANSRILSGFGEQRGGHRHRGIDLRGNHGQAVRAARDGRVVYSGAGLRGYGKTIIIDHGNDLQSLYAHNSSLVVREGDHVERGQVIARVGRTGNASTEHCHFEIRRHDVAVDPLHHLQGGMESAR